MKPEERAVLDVTIARILKDLPPSTTPAPDRRRRDGAQASGDGRPTVTGARRPVLRIRGPLQAGRGRGFPDRRRIPDARIRPSRTTSRLPWTPRRPRSCPASDSSARFAFGHGCLLRPRDPSLLRDLRTRHLVEIAPSIAPRTALGDQLGAGARPFPDRGGSLGDRPRRQVPVRLLQEGG